MAASRFGMVCILVMVLLEHFWIQAEPSGKGFSNKRSRVALSDEGQLLSMLKARYRKWGTLTRPVINASTVVTVGIRFELIQILNLDEANRVLTTHIWRECEWRDEILVWDPQEFGGIQRARLPPSLVWTPDIVLYNNVGKKEKTNSQQEQAVVFDYTGKVTWMPSTIFKSTCPVDMWLFPFDTQTCQFKLGSLTYDVTQMTLDSVKNWSKVHLDNYVVNGEWGIIHNFGERIRNTFECCPYPFDALIYTIKLKRKPVFHMQMILIPVVLLGGVTGVVFWVPPQRPDRTTLAMSVFAAFCVLLLVVVNATPPTSSSKLGIFICAELNAVALVTVVSVVVLFISRTERPPPKCVKKVFVDIFWNIRRKNRYIDSGERTEHLEMNSMEHCRLTNNLGHRERKVTSLKYTEQWNIIATICDRILFSIYVVFFTVCLIFLFPRPGNM